MTPAALRTVVTPCVLAHMRARARLWLQVDVDAPDEDEFPGFSATPYWQDELRPGEMYAWVFGRGGAEEDPLCTPRTFVNTASACCFRAGTR
jgi:hypothetical protein